MNLFGRLPASSVRLNILLQGRPGGSGGAQGSPDLSSHILFKFTTPIAPRAPATNSRVLL
jgi:hypothetical protein